MDICAISDTHGRHKDIEEYLQPADVLVHAGDLSKFGDKKGTIQFFEWLEKLPYEKKIVIAGNHDWVFEQEPEWVLEELKKYPSLVYLNDSGLTYKGINFWGSPVQPIFGHWAFNRARSKEEALKFNKPEIQPHWDLIPANTDVLVTHGPPYLIKDTTIRGSRNVGCIKLRAKVEEIKPKVHIFGHIHESRGAVKVDSTYFYNASTLNLFYQPYKLNAKVIRI